MVIRASEFAMFGEEISQGGAGEYMSQALILEASLVIALFLACFLITYFVAQFGSLRGNYQHEYLRAEVKLPKGLIIVMAAVGAICAGQFYSELTDLTDIILQQTDRNLFEGKGLLFSGMSLLPSAVLAALMCCRTKSSLFVGSLLYLIVLVGVYGPLGQRGNFFTYIILALSVWIGNLGSVRLKWAITVGVVGLFFAEAMALWRTALRYGYENNLSEILTAASTIEGMDQGDFDGLAGIIAYNASINYDSWWKFFEQLIPRAFMHSKQEYVSVSYLVNQEITGSFDSGFTASIIGTFFAQGGLIGVAIGAIFMGILVRWLQNYAESEQETPNGVLVRGLAIAFVFFLTRNGDLTNVVIMLFSNLAGIFLLMGMLSFLPLWRRTWNHILDKVGKEPAALVRAATRK
jgi:hypothetical protein